MGKISRENFYDVRFCSKTIQTDLFILSVYLNVGSIYPLSILEDD